MTNHAPDIIPLLNHPASCAFGKSDETGNFIAKEFTAEMD